MSTNIFIKTFGCSLNKSDSETMSGLLKNAGFKIVYTEEEAFVIIINSCTVKGKTEKKFFKYIEELKNKYKYKKIVITGCIAQADPEKLAGYPLLGTSQISNIVQLVEEALNDNPIEMLEKQTLPRLNLPKIRFNPVIEIIPICEGCLGEPCTYCKVKSARGELRSYPKEEIIKQVRAAVKDMIPEIWLTAQDTGAYGKDIGSSLPELLKEILAVQGNFKIRLGMLNPNHAYEFLEYLIWLYKSDKMFKFIHIPVQSGNNQILKLMKRKYTVEQFKEIVKKFRQAIPEITIATDIICGFPSETEEQFNDSLELVKDIKPPAINISRFFARPKTEAAEMKNKIDNAEKKRRSALITSIFSNISRMDNERWIGWKGEILIDEKNNDNEFVGRNYAYKQVIVAGKFKLGDKVDVKIKQAGVYHLKGEVVFRL